MPHDRLLPFDAAPFMPAQRTPSPIAASVRCGSRVFLSGRSALQQDGTVAALGDAGAQAHAALDNIEAALQAAGGSLRDITKLTTSLVDRGHRKPVYEAIGRRLKDVFPVSTGLLVAGLPLPELMVQIDAEAVVGAPVQRLRTFEMKDWFGQDIAWQGAMVAAGDSELFVRGQTGSALDGSGMAGTGRRPEDAAAQADLALTNLAVLAARGRLGDGRCLQDHRVYQRPGISRRGLSGDRPAFPRHPSGVHRPDRHRLRPARDPVRDRCPCAAQSRADRISRVRPYHSNAVRYGFAQQSIDCDFCMAVGAGGQVILRGQTGTDLQEVMHGAGDAVAQAEQAMENVEVLLGEAGAGIVRCGEGDGVRDRPGVSGRRDGCRVAPVDRRDARLQRDRGEGTRQSGAADGGRHHRDEANVTPASSQ